MALEHGEQERNLPVPRALIVAHLIAMVLAVLALAFGVPAAFRQNNADAKERRWRAFLNRAIGGNTTERLEELLEGRGPLGHQASYALVGAARQGNTATVKVLLRHGAVADTQDRHQDTPLTEAIYNGKLETALALLRGGATVDFPDGEGKTPLHHAAETGNLAAIRLLVKRGANLNVRDFSGQTPLQRAGRGADRYPTDGGATPQRTAQLLRSLGAKD